MIIDCISDLHGHYPQLDGGDLLIIAGDMTKNDHVKSWLEFYKWLEKQNQKYKKCVCIAGNHDNFFSQSISNKEAEEMGIPCDGFLDYLCDSGTEFDGLKIWGSPWTKSFEGMNPKCKYFTLDTEEELAEKWALIPENTDILITHGPPLGIMDKVENFFEGKIEYTGSSSLHKLFYYEQLMPKLHIFGHIHEGHGLVEYMQDMPYTKFINCSYVNEKYQPVNKPIRIEL